ncbi:hypothetical protein BDY17DRAFT_320733 [Neohortaea acidophila]|uniref:Uncharacterized protein n=1 Tax=Neohortaea acidophila TaxID=245834 RepID=A0A6A6Q7G3_9PEZI|nr:uncharacterized protein BDY17DRAFT_320733 [Neohortaea acidophila]KAF2488245.1 hypothetical protein BDY17DRAFT_320733 [Neohortaea acidophila]
MTVLETLRHRTVYADISVSHKLSQDDVYEGYFVDKGSLVHTNISIILQNPKQHPGKDSFNPGRYLDLSYPTHREPPSDYPKVQESIAFGAARVQALPSPSAA